MEKLRQRLTEAGIWDVKLENEVKALWKYGVDRIGDARLRQAVAGFLGIVPKVFFTGPASRSGRFHPPWQNGRHGTLRSIVESCVLVPGMAMYIPEILDAALRPDPHAVDVAMAATIVSDTWKKEDVGDTHYGAEHGLVAAEAWRKFAAGSGLEPAVVEEVAQGSIWHYGIYTPGWTPGTPLAPIARLVNLCDAFTARPELAVIYDDKTVIT